MLAELADPPMVRRVKPKAENEEQLYFIELRYQEYLARRALQELFESGALNHPCQAPGPSSRKSPRGPR